MRREGAVGHEHVDMGVEVEQLTGRLREPFGAGRHFGAVKVGLEVSQARWTRGTTPPGRPKWGTASATSPASTKARHEAL